MTENEIQDIDEKDIITQNDPVGIQSLDDIGSSIANEYNDKKKKLDNKIREELMYKIDQQYNLYDYLSEYRIKDLTKLSTEQLYEHLSSLERILVGRDIKNRYDSEYHALGLVMGTIGGVAITPKVTDVSKYLDNDKVTKQNYYRVRSKYYVPYLDSCELGLLLGVSTNFITCYQNNPNFEGKVSNTLRAKLMLYSEKIINNSYILKYQVLLDKYK